jgi:DNA-binding PadR family transcriptional regulator
MVRGEEVMIRGIILCYLKIKPTHGYEIQRYIQLSGVEQWAKIQSGSIYYALTKLEKEDNITVLREERTGSRVRKIYQITDKGIATLQEEMKEALNTPITNVGSIKFFTGPILYTLSKEDIISITKKHLRDLAEQKQYWTNWQNAKGGGKQSTLVDLSFEMTIQSIENQIKWHEELLNHLDTYIEESMEMMQMLKQFDVNLYEQQAGSKQTEQSIVYMERVKESMKDNPAMLKNVDLLIEELKRQL